MDHHPKLSKIRSAKLALWISALVLPILGLWAFWWEPSHLTVVQRTIAIRPWHPEQAGLRIALMSDLHVGSPFWGLPRLKEVVAAANAEKPDLVLILGDLMIQGVVGGHAVTPEPIAKELAGLQAPLGVVAVLGNHDWQYDGERVRHALESQGIVVLENQNARLTYHGRTFWLCGLADLGTRGEQVLSTLAGIPDAEPVIALTHNPDVFPRITQRISLTVAGHTHGGQVNLPILGRPIVPSRYRQRYAYGLVEENGKKLFVTGGIGTSIWPVRFRVAPEIVILTLVAR